MHNPVTVARNYCEKWLDILWVERHRQWIEDRLNVYFELIVGKQHSIHIVHIEHPKGIDAQTFLEHFATIEYLHPLECIRVRRTLYFRVEGSSLLVPMVNELEYLEKVSFFPEKDHKKC